MSACPSASSPTRATRAVRAPSRLAATAWLPPLPPEPTEASPPRTVSPGAGSASTRQTWSRLTDPTTSTSTLLSAPASRVTASVLSGPVDFALTDEQRSIVEVTRSFVERELLPHEEEVERTGTVRPELIAQIRAKALATGLYAANMPEEVGGAGLDAVTLVLFEKELGRASYALHYTGVVRPSNILLAGTPAQRERYLLPCVRGERTDCLAMTEPGAGSDMRAIRTRAVRDGSDWTIRGTKHFISHADEADFVILLARTGEDDADRPTMSTFLVDLDTPGLHVHEGYRNVSHRGYTNSILEFDDVRVPADALLGEEGKGLELAGEWLGSTRLSVAATCLGRAERALRSRRPTRRPASSSVRPSAGSRASASSWPTWPPSCAPPSCSPCTPPGSSTRAPPPTPTSRWPS